jgi:hypothetical protein
MYSVYPITSMAMFADHHPAPVAKSTPNQQRQWLTIDRALRAVVLNVPARFQSGWEGGRINDSEEQANSTRVYVCHRQVDAIVQLLSHNWAEDGLAYSVLVICPYNAMQVTFATF